MKLRNLTYIFAAAVMSHCTPENPVAKYDSAVYGYLDNIEGKEIYLALQSPEGIIPVDTTVVGEDGYFEFPNNFNTMQVYRVVLDYNKSYLTIAGQKGDKIYLEADGDDIYNNYYVEGSLESELIKEVVDFSMNWAHQFDSVKNGIQLATTQKKGKLLVEYFNKQNSLYKEKQLFTETFISKHPGNIAAYFQVASLPLDEFPEYYELVYNNLSKTHSNFNFLLPLKNLVESHKPIQIGQLAPNLNYTTPQGEKISIEGLRGKYVLIDFWASWCKPCRIENPNLVKLYNLYNGKGFEIYGYSLDKSKDKWMKAIEKDGLNWVQTSDLKGWEAEGAKLYNVNTIPSSFLVDPAGIVIARDLRGDQLAQKLASIFN